jgi:antitoxin component YwqK of YwqJK toxin-antitoxin module
MIKNGPFTLYHPNGKIMAKGQFLNGHYDGIIKQYDSDGRLKTKAYYFNGSNEGMYKEYTRLGGIEYIHEGSMKNNVAQGPWKLSSNGKVLQNEIWERGILISSNVVPGMQKEVDEYFTKVMKELKGIQPVDYVEENKESYSNKGCLLIIVPFIIFCSLVIIVIF